MIRHAQMLALLIVTILALCADGLMDCLGPGWFLAVTLPLAGLALALTMDRPRKGKGRPGSHTPRTATAKNSYSTLIIEGQRRKVKYENQKSYTGENAADDYSRDKGRSPGIG